MNEYLKAIFQWTIEFDTIQNEFYSDIAKNTIITIKDNIISKLMVKKYEKIGGKRLVVVVDETAICRGRLILDPSNELDNIPGVTWIVGGVVEGMKKEVFLVIVPNRKHITMVKVFEEFVEKIALFELMGIPVTLKRHQCLKVSTKL